jgi:hypothetical protein
VAARPGALLATSPLPIRTAVQAVPRRSAEPAPPSTVVRRRVAKAKTNREPGEGALSRGLLRPFIKAAPVALRRRSRTFQSRRHWRTERRRRVRRAAIHSTRSMRSAASGATMMAASGAGRRASGLIFAFDSICLCWLGVPWGQHAGNAAGLSRACPLSHGFRITTFH